MVSASTRVIYGVCYLVEGRLQDGATTLVIFKTPASIFQLAGDLAPQVDDVLDVDLWSQL